MGPDEKYCIKILEAFFDKSRIIPVYTFATGMTPKDLQKRVKELD
jgi:hypothetical protein